MNIRNKLLKFIEDDLLAFFWLSLSFKDNSLRGYLDSNDIEYEVCDRDHKPFEYWENTQHIIYHSFNNIKESLVSILFNELNNKISIHVDSSVDTLIDGFSCEWDKSNDNYLFIKARYSPSFVFDDENIYSRTNEKERVSIANLVDNGYEIAEKIDLNIHNKECLLCIEKCVRKLLEQKPECILSEKKNVLERLIKISLAYTYPSKRYSDKKFSAIVSNSYINSDKAVSSGGLFLLWKENTELLKIVETLDFVRLEKKVMNDSSLKTINELLDFSKKINIKSAKAAIMARNMSHNLGSHVMSYLKNNLDSVQDIVRQRTLSDLLPIKFLDSLPDNSFVSEEIKEKVKGELEKINSVSGKELPFLVGVGRFINYLQERQDYIATISTNYIPPRSSLSFKDFIYDELKPDLRYKRHYKDGKKVDPALNGRKAQNLLLQYIAFSEGYTHSDDIVLKFGAFDGNKVEEGSDKEYDFGRLRQLNVSMPGGVTGRQAFFSIIENIIRNSAKHSPKNRRNKLTIVFDLVDFTENKFKNENHYRDISDISSNYKLSNGKYESIYNIYEKCKNKYEYLTITSELINNYDVIDVLKERLMTPYINETNNEMNGEHKGLKEMRISAAWIRGYVIDTDIDINSEPPAVAVRGIPGENGGCYIQYVIALPKPKKAVFVYPKDEKYNEFLELNDKLSVWGCSVISQEAFMEDKASDYEIVIAATQEVAKCIIPYSSARLIVMKDPDFFKAWINQDKENVLNAEEVDKVLEFYYKEWANSLSKENLPQITIRDTDENNRTICKNNLIDLSDETKEIVVGSNRMKDRIVFAQHFSGLQYKANASYKEAVYIEAITGGNSTDRLIRHSIMDYQWRYKHLGAALSNVAIFDERIFQLISPKVNGPKKEVDIKYILEKWCGLQSYKSYEHIDKKLWKTVSKLFGLTGKLKSLVDNYDQENMISKDISQQSLYTLASTLQYYEKRIWGYDLIFPDERNKEILIVGYNKTVEKTLSDFEGGDVYPIGLIKKVGESFEVEWKEWEKSKWPKFDFIVIHQGLLDKIYGHFAIKEVQDKHKFTHDLHVALSNNQPIKIKNTPYKEWFLPKFIIHSGRSKPEPCDMPQHQPFIQFAAIENAVRDCKYTLVELLSSAHYSMD